MSLFSNGVASKQFRAITASDSAVLSGALDGVLCLTSGNLVVDNWSDVELTIPATAGVVYPVNPKRVKAASTGTYVAL
jgi:hypothetical protein